MHAVGMWAAASQSRRTQALVDGLELADSWATDLHKILNVPYDSGFAVAKRAKDLHRTFSVATLESKDAKHSRFGPQNSTRARGVVAWAAMRSLGTLGVARLVDGLVAHARNLAGKLTAGGISVLNEVVFNQVVAFCDSSELTRDVIAAVQQDGRCWVGPATWQGKLVMRISVCCWATSHEDVNIAAQAILECYQRTKTKPNCC
jgi:glutamate/tyrosine decarboxylase-like PLP-dependent enzyme